VSKTLYVKSAIPYGLIDQILWNTKRSKLIFHIDLQSISRGLYNKNNVFYEINHYMQNNEPSDKYINEYREFLNNLFLRFKFYNPFFVTFYDDGHNSQNVSISNSYKGGRSKLSNIIEEDEELMLYRRIKKRYFEEIEKKCTIENVGKVYYLREYESDLIPFYIITNNYFQSGENSTLNVVLSNDKDLLQCCQFNNTVQITNTFIPDERGYSRLRMECWDNNNAVTYIYRKFRKGSITSKDIPLILALSGDKADQIDGIKGIGPKKAINLIENFEIPSDPTELENKLEDMPKVIKDNINMIVKNIKMISFKEQIKRTKLEKEKL